MSTHKTLSDWVVATVRASNLPGGLFVYPRVKPDNWKSRPLSEEISISWDYEGDLPDTDTEALMNEFEEDFVWEHFTSENQRYVLKMTVGGLREWVFYSNDYEAFMCDLNARLEGKRRYPIKIKHMHDPDWGYWHRFVDWLETN